MGASVITTGALSLFIEKGDTPLSASPQERVCEKGVIVV
jgi:hypothetical protein